MFTLRSEDDRKWLLTERLPEDDVAVMLAHAASGFMRPRLGPSPSFGRARGEQITEGALHLAVEMWRRKPTDPSRVC